jgi:hypothetical protein
VKLEQESGRGTAIKGELVLAALAALLYGLSLSRHYTADSIISALINEGDNRQGLGWSERSLLPLQMLNGVAGAICVGLMWGLANKLSRSPLAATIIAAGFALSGGLWLLSVEAEFVTIALALQLLALRFIFATPAETAGRPGFAVGLGIVVAIGIVGYLTSAFLVTVALVGFVTSGLTPEVRRRQITIFPATVLLLAIQIIVLALTLWSGEDLTQLQRLPERGAYGQL